MLPAALRDAAPAALLAPAPGDLGLDTDDEAEEWHELNGEDEDGDSWGALVRCPREEGVIQVHTQGFRLEPMGEAIVQELVRRQAFAEYGAHMSVLDMGFYCQKTMEALTRLRFIQWQDDQFGGQCAALALSNVRLRGGLIAESPRLVAASPLTDNTSFAKWSKLEVMQHLLQIGWKARPSGELKPILPPDASGAREFAIDAASKPLSSLRAMVLAPSIFTKPGNLMFSE